MAITLDGKIYRNLQEQVEANKDAIEKLEAAGLSKLFYFVIDMNDFTYSNSYTYDGYNQYAGFLTTQEITSTTKYSDLDFNLMIPITANLELSSNSIKIVECLNESDTNKYVSAVDDIITVSIRDDNRLYFYRQLI